MPSLVQTRQEHGEIVRRAAKKDDNHKIIVEALRKVGAYVQDLGSVGSGCPDLLCDYRGAWTLIEVKDGEKVQSARKLTPDQINFVVDLRNRAPVHVAESPEQAIQIVTRGG